MSLLTTVYYNAPDEGCSPCSYNMLDLGSSNYCNLLYSFWVPVQIQFVVTCPTNESRERSKFSIFVSMHPDSITQSNIINEMIHDQSPYIPKDPSSNTKSIHKSISPTVRNGATWSMSLAWFCQLACNLPSVLLQLLNDRARKPFSNFRNQRSLLRVNIPFITKNEEWTYRACMYSRQPRVLFP